MKKIENKNNNKFKKIINYNIKKYVYVYYIYN